MTHLDLYSNALIEQNKLEAPTLLIEDYNYLINKAILQYINLTYARFDLNQQTSDDLRWLQRSVELDVFRQDRIIHPMEEANYVCALPLDYLHILNCTVHFSAKGTPPIKASKCKNIDDDTLGGIFSLCRRLTANQFPAIIQNAYLKPTYKRPYFYINTSGEPGRLSTLLASESILEPCNDDWRSDLNQILDPCGSNEDCDLGKLMEIRCGRNKYVYPDVAFVDYLKVPEKINLTWEQVNDSSGIDTTPECEFPDAVAYEIINIFVKLLFENASDERLQTHFAINQTIGGIPQTESKK